MLSFIIKSVLTISSLFFTVYFFATGYWGWGISFIFLSAILSLTYFRNENIILALNQMRVGNHEKAYLILKRISYPQLLIKSQRAYFYYLTGMLGAQEMGLSKSEQLIRKALSIGLRTNQDKAVAHMHIGGICLQTGRKREALNMFDEAKRLDKDGMLADQLKMLKKQATQVASKNQMRMAQMGGGRMKTGKVR
jgi:tetratricopeptide (TPR) repeat protein